MKRMSIGVILISIVCIVFVLGFSNTPNPEPNSYYQVYLDDEVVGVIDSKDELESYIDKQGDHIKKKYQTNKVYAPNGLEIKKIVTYHDKVDTAKEVYDKIQKMKPFTIKGFQFKIKSSDESKSEILYVNKKSILQEAIENTIKTFVGEEDYNAYTNETQTEIETTGSYINNIYVQNDLTIKEVRIPVTEKIYTDATELSQYLLFGATNNKYNYTVQVGDTIEQVAFNNKISVEEFFISNPQFTSRQNLLYPGQAVVIGMTDPKIQVVVEKNEVSDVVNSFPIEERYDSNKLVGEDEIIQAGENGLERVTQKLVIVNGDTIAAEIQHREELKPAITQIIVKGDKVIPSVGSGAWFWPVPSHYVISPMGYRIDPINGRRALHTGADISERCWKPIYAANNGVVTVAGVRSDNGNYVTINHNNGYYTLYAHMSSYIVRTGQVVSKGQVIGYVGRTGRATGCHLHFEAWKGGAPWRGQVINALTLY